MMPKTKLPYWLAWTAPLGYIHEIFHYIPAKIFGMNPEIYAECVSADTEDAPAWQILIVIITPFAVTIAVLVSILVFWASIPDPQPKTHLRMGLWAALALAWCFGCAKDVKAAYKLLKDGKNE